MVKVEVKPPTECEEKQRWRYAEHDYMITGYNEICWVC